jgi:outer membrane protein assembly factor BamB
MPVVIALATGLFASAAASAADWPMFRGNVANTGVADAARAVELNGPPAFLWRFDTGGVVESSPAIVDGVLYQGSFNRALFALDAASGRELWRFHVGGLLRASPAVVDGLVYFGAHTGLIYGLAVP